MERIRDLLGGMPAQTHPDRRSSALGHGGAGRSPAAYTARRWARCVRCMRKHLRPIGKKNRLRTQASPCCGERLRVLNSGYWK